MLMQGDIEANVKMLAYVRERSRILQLCELLLFKEELMTQNLSVNLFQQAE